MLFRSKDFLANTGFGVFENDGSYPGDTCAATNHPGHHGLEDSQWVQFQAIADLYQWCCAHGVYINVPDWYMLNGSTKTAMGYKEGNWSLPRAEQEIIERQNIYDSTWEKTSSMGWMMVPLTEYGGGGAAATIEPLCEHLPHYEARLAELAITVGRDTAAEPPSIELPGGVRARCLGHGMLEIRPQSTGSERTPNDACREPDTRHASGTRPAVTHSRRTSLPE